MCRPPPPLLFELAWLSFLSQTHPGAALLLKFMMLASMRVSDCSCQFPSSKTFILPEMTMQG